MGSNVHWANVLYEWDYQCALGMGLSNVPWEWDYAMCSGKEQANVLRKWDYPMYPGNGTIKCVLERN